MYGGGWVKYNKRLIRKLKGVVTNRRTALLGGFVNWSILKNGLRKAAAVLTVGLSHDRCRWYLAGGKSPQQVPPGQPGRGIVVEDTFSHPS